jgi:hypothetical protein
VAGAFGGYVVRRKGRATAFSTRTDAAAVFRGLRRLGTGYRQAEDAVSAMMGVDRGELARGLSTVESSGEAQDALLATYAIGKHCTTIHQRIKDPDVNAGDAIANLPPGARAWLYAQLAHFSQGAT